LRSLFFRFKLLYLCPLNWKQLFITVFRKNVVGILFIFAAFKKIAEAKLTD